ncbi:DUF3488 and transglutaminase-like domain-containing protein [Ornithinimicrobium sp. F0845]|uniref:transglutaminase TgpA family protein n=1 Tax=Ornithinimicrobium sp. F0845 TaxID=2926412 RepID=UPI001FF512D3|nr:DUF3488 and transglutaminase-like domain-containing protein [Ornithinimicrobium sp. F0845]MCK0112657.1 DUF3488 and transglutaminase-like domain-containing protein [Ornithinimicrobium sp. F0845]
MRFNLDRGLWPEAGLAALATLTVAWPLTNLLREGDWIGPAILLVLLVAVVGAVLRSLDADPTLVVLGQALAVLGALVWRYLSDTLMWVVVPGPDTLDRATELLREAGRTLQSFAAPAPTNEGVEFLIVSVLALTAVSVDAIGVTGRAPATAGLPLAAAFLVSVSNSGRAMDPWFFAAAALAWLLMVAQQGNRLVSGWSSADRRESVGAHDVSHGPSGHRTVARVLAVVTVLGALVLASVVPHLPPTFFAEGLARDPDGRSVGGSGQVSFTETMDVTADLHDQSDDPVIRFRSPSRPLQPLRVTATNEYDGERWLPPDYDPGPPQAPQLTPGTSPQAAMADELSLQVAEMSVLSNSLGAPHLALPGPVLSVTSEDTTMQWDAELAAVRVSERPDTYQVSFLQVAQTGRVPDGVGDAEADPGEWEDYLQVDPDGEAALSALADQVVGDATNDLEVANLIQQHFRSGLYTYSLQLAPGAGGDDAISHFLQTRQGYCVQFATAMVMMARQQGIPARMAVGFLPGELQANGSFSVVVSDAHTWPELWIDGLGWTRFEPTPGIRSGPPPPYSELNSGAGEEVPTVTETATPTGVPTQQPEGTAEDTSWWEDLQDFVRSAAPILLRALVVVVLLGVLMAVVAIAGRRHRESVLRHAATPQERIEGQWELLKRSLEDYGIDPPPDRSPREMASHYVTAARLDRPTADAMGRATTVLERARYADASRTQDTDDTTMHGDVMRVLDSVSAKLPWNIRASAKLFPRSGWHYLRALPGRLLRR